MWVKMIYDELHPEKRAATEKAAKADEAGIVTAAQVIKQDERDDPDLAAYNRYLARLNAQGGRS
jgi:hypothetical protein